MAVAVLSMLDNVGHVLDHSSGGYWQGVRRRIDISEDIFCPVSGVGDLVQFSCFVVNTAARERQGGLRCECPGILKMDVLINDAISKYQRVNGVAEFSRQAEKLTVGLRIHGCDTATRQWFSAVRGNSRYNFLEPKIGIAVLTRRVEVALFAVCFCLLFKKGAKERSDAKRGKARS